LIAESRRSIALREFCARVLGWDASRARAVDHALRAIRLAAALRSPLVLHGEEDLVPLAYALHRRVLGIGAPFVVCDSRRHDRRPASTRFGSWTHQPPQWHGCIRAGRRGVAVHAAPALAMRSPRASKVAPRTRPPRAVDRLHGPTRTRRASQRLYADRGSSIRTREAELPRIVHAYAEDAIAALNAPASSFLDDDHHWVMQNARSLWEIEKATLRVVALNITRNRTQAARLLGLREVSLSRWIDRRMPLPPRQWSIRICWNGRRS
jgi:hypothetical protein